MSEEEKKAIEFYTGKEISFELDWTPEQKKTFEKALGIDKEPSFEEHQIKIQTLLNLIKNQQKEIEELKKDKKALTNNYDRVLSCFISKDKIREKLKKRAEMIKELSDEDNEGYIDTMAIDRIEYEVGILQELLEE